MITLENSRPTGLEVNPCAWRPGFCPECIGCHLEPQTRTPPDVVAYHASVPSALATHNGQVPTDLPMGHQHNEIVAKTAIRVMTPIGERSIFQPTGDQP